MKQWLAKRIQQWPLSRLKPYSNNPRTHSSAQVERIAASIREFGFVNPILVDKDGVIVAGHGRLEAAKRLGLQTVPVIVLDHLTETQRRALVIADNRLAELSEWNDDLLAKELERLLSEDYDIGITGWDEDEVNRLLAAADAVVEGRTDPDAVPAPEPEPVSQPGDIWVLGRHRVMCGDSTSITDMERLLDGQQADCCWTDPPYNVDVGDITRKRRKGEARDLKNDKLSSSAFRDFLSEAFATLHTALKPGSAVYVAHADTERVVFTDTFVRAGFHLSSVIIWVKDSLVIGRSDYQWQHEPILYGWKPGKAHRWYGGRSQTTVQELGDGSPFRRRDDGLWEIRIGDDVIVVREDAVVEVLATSVIHEPKPRKNEDHPTTKPVALIERMLRNSTRAGDVVLDPFGGSGSTLIACERLGLSARLMELDPVFCDVIVRRWEQYTGRKASRLS